MHKPNMVRHAMHTFPVDRGRTIPGDACVITQYRKRCAGFWSNSLVAESALGYSRNTSVCLRCNRPVAERAVKAKTHELLVVCTNAQEIGSSVGCVREINGLNKGLLEPKDRYWLAKPTVYDESHDSGKDSDHADTTQSQDRDHDLQPGRRRLIALFDE